MKKSNKKTTVKDIAIALNVSASTVSRALKNNKEISQKTKEVIWEKAKKMGYLPNIPVYMQNKKNKIIIFFIDTLSNSSHQKIIEKAQESLGKNGYNTLIKFLSSKKCSADLLSEILIDIDTIGVISLLENNQINTIIHQAIKNQGLPLVTVNRSISNIADINILPDMSNGSYLATKHLLNRGVKNILLITHFESRPYLKDLEIGINSALATSNYTSLSKLEIQSNYKNLNFEMNQFLKKPGSSVEAIITENYDTAFQLYHYLKNKNIIIPDDLMLIVFGSNQINEISLQKLTSVECSYTSMGNNAAISIDKLIHKKEIENTIIIEPTSLIIRSSSMKIFKNNKTV